MLLRTENVLNAQYGLRYGSVSAAFLWSLPLGGGTAASSAARAALAASSCTRRSLVRPYVSNPMCEIPVRGRNFGLEMGTRSLGAGHLAHVLAAGCLYIGGLDFKVGKELCFA